MENQHANQLLWNSVVMHYMWIYNSHIFLFIVYMWPLRWNHASLVKYVRSRVLGCCITNDWFNTWKWTCFLVHLKQLLHHSLIVRVQFCFLHFFHMSCRTVGSLEKTCAMICKWKFPVTHSHIVLPNHTYFGLTMLIHSFTASLIFFQQLLNTALWCWWPTSKLIPKFSLQLLRWFHSPLFADQENIIQLWTSFQHKNKTG